MSSIPDKENIACRLPHEQKGSFQDCHFSVSLRALVWNFPIYSPSILYAYRACRFFYSLPHKNIDGRRVRIDTGVHLRQHCTSLLPACAVRWKLYIRCCRLDIWPQQDIPHNQRNILRLRPLLPYGTWDKIPDSSFSEFLSNPLFSPFGLPN